MTRRTRYFMAGSVAVLAAGLAIGLVAYHGGFSSLSASRTGPAELRYVPADATVIAYADVRNVMTSDFRQRFREAMPDGQAQDDFQQKTGINIETDIDHVLAGMMPDGGGGPGGGLVVARGRFDVVRLEALARGHGGGVEDYRGTRLLVSGADLHGHGGETAAGPFRGAMAFLEPGLIALGDEAAVRRAIDAQAGGQSISSNDEIMRLVGDIELGSNAWAVGRFDVLTQRANLPEQVSRQIPAIRWFAAAGRINGGISGTLRAETIDDEAAENLRDVIRGFLALGRLQAGGRPEIQSALQSLQLGGTGRTVSLSFAVPAEVLDAIGAAHRGAN
jgi:hypothetical protein